eukprot:scaffold38942_cov53-Prasinocladus_malaysianus.AAC.1
MDSRQTEAYQGIDQPPCLTNMAATAVRVEKARPPSSPFGEINCKSPCYYAQTDRADRSLANFITDA